MKQKLTPKKIDCACNTIYYGTSIGFCPLHAAAPEMLILLKENLKVLKETISELGGCDHSVGVCYCGLIKLADDTGDVIVKAEGQKHQPDIAKQEREFQAGRTHHPTWPNHYRDGLD